MTKQEYISPDSIVIPIAHMALLSYSYPDNDLIDSTLFDDPTDPSVSYDSGGTTTEAL